MRFGKKLRNTAYPKWKGQYMDYAKLKAMLRENEEDDSKWTETDENKFCDEILNVQLEKVAAFQQETFKSLEQRANACADKLKDLVPEDGKAKGDITTGRFKEIETELDEIINETKELKKYSNINYTAFLKIVKKHDRKRGNNYKIRPMMLMSLSKRPFNTESGYSPLLNKLSIMYYAVRQQLDETEATPATSASEAQSQIQNGERYTAYKFWVHPDNLLEVKTYILRRLPVLVYSEQSAKDLENQGDPTLNSLYFDNPEFSLYNQKVDRQVDASSLRIRWFGQFKSGPEFVIEKKMIHENGTSEERKFAIKEKYIQAFIRGEYKMEKAVAKMERQGQPAAKIQEFKDTVVDIQKFIIEKELQPVLRANYTRTAFQKPLDDKVRISIDTCLAFIREDAIDPDRPCRNPENWHRLDIDEGAMTYPFTNVNKGEISRFPYSILEIKVKEEVAKKHPQWVEDLMASHLVHKAPRFSKFVHGVASLFEDNVNNLPFWLSELETDIRRDPQAAFEEEEERKAKRRENEQVVGSLLGATPKASSSFRAAVSSPLGKSYMAERMAAEERAGKRSDFSSRSKSQNDNSIGEEGEDEEGESSNAGAYGTMSSIFPSFSLSRYAQSRRERNVILPPGVTKPKQLIKDSGPLQVEPKVWLANERTFLKWQHICVLLGVLAVSLYNTAGKNRVAEIFGFIYLAIAIFAGIWGTVMHRVRRNMIVERSGKDFDNMIGPMVVSFALMMSLILNFYFQYHAAMERLNEPVHGNVTITTAAPLRTDVKIELL
ncbi:Phosphate metabolism transcription protein [Cadophora gregata]|uniref:Phosphate metabolism transcription protein n=1 Tax=Cadophora gregata TaxID=51156 RepID=UPI0026DB5AE4|nr:Phosphate metabolism transcription protein [Cadophora gregata]KAK0122111.1 Phosphate metabolism transcription protein [Cadophora gregata]